MNPFSTLQTTLSRSPQTWCVTGCAGFIGSHLVERLLSLDQRVVGLDNFATGNRANLDDVRACVSTEQWARFRMIEGDICALETCREACRGVDVVLHQAALGSVPRSIENPLRSHAVNVDGFLNMLEASRDAGVKRFVYASSSSVYGDHPALPKVEHVVGQPLSPYAVTKATNEAYAAVFSRCYGLPTFGLRYFNVFGPRQDPNGAYAAVVPKWFAALRHGAQVRINGTGETSRDFCYIENVVQANLLAGAAEPRQEKGVGRKEKEDCDTKDGETRNKEGSPLSILLSSLSSAGPAGVYNIACGDRTTLLELYQMMRSLVAERRPELRQPEPVFGPERAGDVRHSLANIDLARQNLGYEPAVMVREGLRRATEWYLAARRPGE